MTNLRLDEFVERLLELATPDASGRGLRLPPERELGERLEMSRPALREQLSVLDGLGFLDRRQGRGAHLRMPDDEFVRTYFAISRSLGSIDDAQYDEARVMIEEAVAARAAELATPEQAHELRAHVDAMIAFTRDGEAEAAFEEDVRFHSALSAIVGNPIFRFLDAGLGHVLRDAIRTRRRTAIEAEQPDADGVRQTDRVHYAIVEAIEANDPERARAAMRAHFDDWRKIERGTP